MAASDLFHYLALMEIIFTVAGDASMIVIQYPLDRTALQGDNVTFSCKFSSNQPSSDLTFHWWKRGESEYLHKRRDNRTIFGFKSFQLLNVTSQDSGVYHCAVICQGKALGNGTGSRLIVHVPPTPLKIFSRDSEGESTTSLTLVCETAAFYPEDITLTWSKDGNEVKTGINFRKERDSNGLYRVSSYLEDTQPVQSRVVYSCSVSHNSLRIPAVSRFTVSKSNSDNPGIPFMVIIRFILCFVVVLALTIIIVDYTRIIPLERWSKEETSTSN